MLLQKSSSCCFQVARREAEERMKSNGDQVCARCSVFVLAVVTCGSLQVENLQTKAETLALENKSLKAR